MVRSRPFLDPCWERPVPWMHLPATLPSVCELGGNEQLRRGAHSRVTNFGVEPTAPCCSEETERMTCT